MPDQQTRAALIEAMAKRMAQLYTRDERRMETRRDQEIAAELLASIEAHAGGCVVVPVEATEGVLDGFWDQSGESRLMRRRTHERGKHYWRKMIAASPYAKERADDPR